MNVFDIGEAFDKAEEVHDEAICAFDDVEISYVNTCNQHLLPLTTLKYIHWFSALAEEVIEGCDSSYDDRKIGETDQKIVR